jgi:tripartite-type tricarboxylate transporter receptor subunit TctC
MNMRKSTTLSVLAAALAVAAPAPAQTWPAKPLRFIVPFPPGGTTDIQARMINERLAARIGQPVVLDFRSGANAAIGMEITARAPADGYTMIISTVGSWAVAPHLTKLPYDVQADFAPLIHMATTPGVLIVHPSVPARNVKELIALARQRPGDLTYGSSGIGGFGHICAELFRVTANIRMNHVPYKGSGPSLLDLMGGHIQVLFNSALPTVPHINSGRLRALATTGAKRMNILPDLPTVAEAGLKGYENSTWSALGMAARTPAPIVDRLNREINAILQLPEVQEAARADGSTITGGTPEQFRDMLKSELAKFGALIKTAGIKGDGS